jgi:Na+/melibiose symporter-like transporter
MFVVMLIGLTLLVVSDGLTVLWQQDSTKLSFLLLVIFIGMSVWCGFKTWLLSRFIDSDKEDEHIVEKVEGLMEVGWFTSDLCLSIGMMGTVIGFIMMLSGLAQVDVSDINTVQGLIKNLGSGMSTALYSTLTGLICSSLLKVQYFNLNQSIDQVRR